MANGVVVTPTPRLPPIVVVAAKIAFVALMILVKNEFEDVASWVFN